MAKQPETSTASSSFAINVGNEANQPSIVLPQALQDEIGRQVASKLAENVLGETTKRAQGFLSLYANIDFVRPYFDVEPSVVLKRLGLSFLPFRKEWSSEEVMDLYTPSMLTMTLVAILIYRMKLGSVHLNEGTIMGTSFALCFTYWIVISLMAYFMGYLFDFKKVTIVQSFSIIGYGFSGYCLPLALEFFIANEQVMYLIFLVVGGLSAATIMMTFVQYSTVRQNGLLVGGVAAFFHFTFLFYLKIAYGAAAHEVFTN